MNFFEIAFYARDERDRVSRRGVAGEVEIVGDGLGYGFGDGNRRREAAVADDASSRFSCDRIRLVTTERCPYRPCDVTS